MAAAPHAHAHAAMARARRSQRGARHQGGGNRSGQHCAHPVLQYYGVAATCRASLAFYNTHAEIEAFMAALKKVRALLG